ncbi:MAG: M23 family metallopeptidase [Gemmatimonadaceae bacterium]
MKGAGRADLWVPLAVTAMLTGCAVEGDETPNVDTVLVVDTLVRFDTLIVVDTVVALGIDSLISVPESGAGTEVTREDIAYLRSRRLLVPVAGVPATNLPDNFDAPRGSRRHNAMDLLAPRGTPVLSTDDGRIVQLHTSDGGGLTIYATDPQERFIYFYAHLDRYRPGIAQDTRVAQGDTIGFVGTTGNAPANVPHLHFAIARADEEKRWWAGTPIDPRPFLTTALLGP